MGNDQIGAEKSMEAEKRMWAEKRMQRMMEAARHAIGTLPYLPVPPEPENHHPQTNVEARTQDKRSEVQEPELDEADSGSRPRGAYPNVQSSRKFVFSQARSADVKGTCGVAENEDAMKDGESPHTETANPVEPDEEAANDGDSESSESVMTWKFEDLERNRPGPRPDVHQTRSHFERPERFTHATFSWIPDGAERSLRKNGNKGTDLAQAGSPHSAPSSSSSPGDTDLFRYTVTAARRPDLLADGKILTLHMNPSAELLSDETIQIFSEQFEALLRGQQISMRLPRGLLVEMGGCGENEEAGEAGVDTETAQAVKENKHDQNQGMRVEIHEASTERMEWELAVLRVHLREETRM